MYWALKTDERVAWFLGGCVLLQNTAELALSPPSPVRVVGRSSRNSLCFALQNTGTHILEILSRIGEPLPRNSVERNRRLASLKPGRTRPLPIASPFDQAAADWVVMEVFDHPH